MPEQEDNSRIEVRLSHIDPSSPDYEADKRDAEQFTVCVSSPEFTHATVAVAMELAGMLQATAPTYLKDTGYLQLSDFAKTQLEEQFTTMVASYVAGITIHRAMVAVDPSHHDVMIRDRALGVARNAFNTVKRLFANPQ